MKVLKTTICVLLCAMICSSRADASDVLRLNNGSVIKGDVIETTPGKTVKIRTKDGSVFVYNLDEVEQISKDESSLNESNNTGHRGLDFDIDAGYNINTKGGGGAVAADVLVGKRFNKSIYWGLGAGVNISTGGSTVVTIPVETRLNVFFPIGDSKFTPFGSLTTGYNINTKGGDGSYFVSLAPGFSYPLSSKVDFNFSAGYAHSFYKGGNGGAVVIKVGFSFHKPLVPGEKGPYIPTRDKGLQITFEGEGVNPWNIDQDQKQGMAAVGGSLILGYKMSPNISFGIGYGADWMSFASRTTDTRYSGQDLEGEVKNVSEGWDYMTNNLMHRIFVRGQYRLNDKRFSPIAALDLGLRLYRYDSEYMFENSIEDYRSSYDGLSKAGFFVTPQVGFSWRTTNNSYLEMKLGYTISGSLKEFRKTANWPYGNGSELFVGKKISMAGLFISIGWTRTLKWLSGQ